MTHSEDLLIACRQSLGFLSTEQSLADLPANPKRSGQKVASIRNGHFLRIV
jgi:hypothetical protein